MFSENEYRFRPIKKADLEWARILHNSEDVLSVLTDITVVSKKQQMSWFKKLSKSKTSQRLVIEYRNNRIGLIRLDDIDNNNKSICVGLDIDEKFRGKGHGFNSFKILLKYCFDVLEMNRAWLLVADFNKRAYNLYKKLNFTVEGVQRQRLFRKNEYHDYIMMSILRSEYYKEINSVT